jgi:hypothetical protein
VSTRVELLLAAFAAGVLVVALFPTVAMALAAFAQVELTRVVLGMGPRIATKRVGGTALELRAVPISSYAMAVGQGLYPDDAGQPGALRPGRVPWREASPVRRALAFVVAPRLAGLVFGSLVLGPQRAAIASLRGAEQYVRGALGPMSDAHALLDAGLDLLGREGVLVLAAVVVCKWVGFSLLTLPSDLAGAVDTSLSAARAIGKVRFLVLLVFLAMAASWIVACIAWLAA